MDRLSPIKEILERTGDARYGGEKISQLQHALQCAALAEDAGCDAALITAALLQDIGQLVDQHAEGAAAAGVDRRHEDIGSGYLAKFFGPEVTLPVKLHVPAKRDLCAVDAAYFSSLSAASVTSLKVQGGPFSEEEAAHFIAKPHAADAVRLRRWDDLGKTPNKSTPGLDHFLGYAETIVQ
ncbi:MAG: phosphonate degradation HD-domain oxygenase [Pseudomonadota bacterium]|nr:phosphonate degradation HD-domain oxygenase [Pseudomonadota bacterium]